MGWAFGIVDGREVGYGVESTCDQDGCEAEIDRGLAYCCGGMHGGGEHGCGRYFCYEHLSMVVTGGQLCEECTARWEADNPEDDDEQEVPA